MAHDLLSRIRGELQERMRALRPAVDECERLQDDLRALQAVPEPSASVTRLRVGRPLPRTRMVSPKVARLMHTPRRPVLERRGVVRVGAARLDFLPDDLADEIDAEAERRRAQPSSALPISSRHGALRHV